MKTECRGDGVDDLEEALRTEGVKEASRLLFRPSSTSTSNCSTGETESKFIIKTKITTIRKRGW